MQVPRNGEQSVSLSKDVIIHFSILIYHIVFEEQFKYKGTKRAEQRQYELTESKDPTKEFDLIVKASNPKKKVSTVVKSSNSYQFQKSITTLMQ